MITSHRNPLVKRIRALERKKQRQEEGAFYVEGIRVVLSALEREAPVELLVYAPGLLTSEVARSAIRQFEARGGETAAVSDDVFRAFSQRDNPTGLGAIVAARLHPLESLPVTRTPSLSPPATSAIQAIWAPSCAPWTAWARRAGSRRADDRPVPRRR